MWQEIITGIIIAAVSFMWDGNSSGYSHTPKRSNAIADVMAARHRKGGLVLLRHPTKALNNKQLSVK